MSVTRIKLASRPAWKRVTKRKFSVWELEQRLMQQHITHSQYNLARRKAKSLSQRLKRGKFALLEVARQHYKKLIIAE